MSPLKNIYTFFPDLSRTVVVVILVLIAAFAFFKWLSKFLIEKDMVSLKRLELADAIFDNNLVNPDHKQRYLVEQWFVARYAINAPFDEIAVLFATQYPSKACRFFVKCWPFVKLNQSKSIFELRKNYPKNTLLGLGKEKYHITSFSYILVYLFFFVLGGLLCFFSVSVVLNIFNMSVSDLTSLEITILGCLVLLSMCFGVLFIYLGWEFHMRSLNIHDVDEFLELFDLNSDGALVDESEQSACNSNMPKEN